MDPQQPEFINSVSTMMVNVLNGCNKVKKNCVCSIRVKYLHDSDLPENKKYKTEVFCDEAGTDFYKDISAALDKKQQTY